MKSEAHYDVAIVGAGPAGLSAALVLGRCRRRVVIVDHDRPRNFAARTVNGYLGVHHASPAEFRAAGHNQLAGLDVEFIGGEVTNVAKGDVFALTIDDHRLLTAKKLLLATGVVDCLPAVERIREFYGTSVHHCPYCDGLEHADEQLFALGDGDGVVGLALTLRNWSERVTACSNGTHLANVQRRALERNGIDYRPERLVSLAGSEGRVSQAIFESGPPLDCDALFFSGERRPGSNLAVRLGCEPAASGTVQTGRKERTCVPGVFVAGDASGDVQFAIVAAAEGAIAATAINRELQDEAFGPEPQ